MLSLWTRRLGIKSRRLRSRGGLVVGAGFAVLGRFCVDGVLVLGVLARVVLERGFVEGAAHSESCYGWGAARPEESAGRAEGEAKEGHCLFGSRRVFGLEGCAGFALR